MRAEIEKVFSRAFTDDEWDMYRGEVEYLIEEGILSKLNEACYWVGKNFDDVKQNWEDFKNWKPPSD
jgi:hypothetical protein